MCVGNKVVIDDVCNMNARKLTARTVSATNIFGKLCGDLRTKSIKEKVFGQGITMTGDLNISGNIITNLNVDQDLNVIGDVNIEGDLCANNIIADSFTPNFGNVTGNIDILSIGRSFYTRVKDLVIVQYNINSNVNPGLGSKIDIALPIARTGTDLYKFDCKLFDANVEVQVDTILGNTSHARITFFNFGATNVTKACVVGGTYSLV